MRGYHLFALPLLCTFLAGCNAKCNVGGGVLDIDEVKITQTKKGSDTEVLISFRVNHIQGNSKDGKNEYDVLTWIEVEAPKGFAGKKKPWEKRFKQTESKKVSYVTCTVTWTLDRRQPRGEYKLTLNGKDNIAEKEVSKTTTFTLE